MSILEKLFGKKKRQTADSPALIRQNLTDGKAIMLDVRGQEERDAGFLEDSIFIPITQIKELSAGTQSLDGLPKDKIVYCH